MEKKIERRTKRMREVPVKQTFTNADKIRERKLMGIPQTCQCAIPATAIRAQTNRPGVGASARGS